jgi:hypothetical protein
MAYEEAHRRGASLAEHKAAHGESIDTSWPKLAEELNALKAAKEHINEGGYDYRPNEMMPEDYHA